MPSPLAAIVVLCLLHLEGYALAGALLPVRSRILQLSLALPLAALSNALILAALTIFSLPLAPLWIGLPHIIVTGLAWWVSRRNTVSPEDPHSDAARSFHEQVLRWGCWITLGITAVFAVVHSVFLPTIAIDSFSNWTHRAQVSFEDRAIAFDETEVRGVAKPQYPILLHALQITANQGQVEWNDRLANIVTFFLTFGSFAAVFLLIRRLRGITSALVATTLITTIPLMSIHLAQGYGDIHLVQYLLLSLLALGSAQESGGRRWLLLSAIFIGAALWTKTDGLVFGYGPWIAAMLLMIKASPKRMPLVGISLLPLALYLPMIAILLLRGLGLTPHETDTAIGWYGEGVVPLLQGLFASGSLGISVYAVIAGLLAFGWYKKYSPETIDCRHEILLLIGGLSFLAVLFVYLCTPNVAFLLNGQSFFRQMLIPLALLMAGCALVLPRAKF